MAKKSLVHKEVPDDAYAAGWDGNFQVPTKNALYDKIETLGAGGSPTVTANTGTVISLANPLGNLCNARAADTANANTTFTTTGGVLLGWARVLINTTSEPTITGATKQQGSDWVASTDMYMDVWSDGTDEYFNFIAIASTYVPTLSRAFTIPAPVATDDYPLFYTPVAITVTSVVSGIKGGTNWVFNITHAAALNGTQLDVFTSDITLTSESGQINNTGFNDATIPAGSYIQIKTTSVLGIHTWGHVTIIYTED